MPNELVAAVANFRGYLGRIVIDRRVHQVTHREAKRIEKVEHTPDSDPQTIVPPREIPHVGLGAGVGRCVTKPLAETEMFNIETEINGKALAIGPVVIRPFSNRRIVVSVMFFQFHVACPGGLNYLPDCLTRKHRESRDPHAF